MHEFASILLVGFLAVIAPVNAPGAITPLEFFGFPPLSQSPYAGLYLGSDGNFYGTSHDGGRQSSPSGFGTVFQLTPSGKLTVLNPMGFDPGQGLPQSPIVQGPDGQIYGEAAGASSTVGALLKVNTNGVVTQAFHVCEPVGGMNPFGGLTWGTDGRLYGTLSAGGVSSAGSIFSITTNGVFTKLNDFPGAPGGATPYCSLVADIYGNFFGTTYSGGTNNLGSIFKRAAGGQLVTLASFTGTSGLTPGKQPGAGLILGPGGYLYGTTEAGGASNNGTIFRIDTLGIAMTNLASFTGTNGATLGIKPLSGLIADKSGILYGTTSGGGPGTTYGTVYKVSADGTFSSIFAFRNTNGSYPQGTLIFGNDGLLYGTTTAGGAYTNGTAFAMTTDGNLATFYHFGEPTASDPSELLLGLDGNYYATSHSGGQSLGGVLFRLTPRGLYTSLVSFNLTNGSAPTAGLVQDSNGILYGTTYSGGSNGFGTVFKCDTDGHLTTLFSFDALNYGSHPQSKLVFGSDGNFYGTTYDGTPSGGGTVFQMTTNGSLTNIVTFVGPNGYNPYADLAPGLDGNLYGTTEAGGVNGKGTIFRINLPAGTFTSLASFSGTNGEKPEGRLTWGKDGNLYGTTRLGGIGGTNGVLFRSTTSGTITPLVSFDFATNGSQPYAGLLLANDTNFYGTTSLGGTNGGGTVFRLTPTGQFTNLVSLVATNIGVTPVEFPQTALIQATDGSLLGTAPVGGTYGRGTVYKLSLGLKPTVPAANPIFVSAGFMTPFHMVLTLTSATADYWPVSVYFTSNFVTWSAVTTNVYATNGYYVITDARTTNVVRRFYRASSP